MEVVIDGTLTNYETGGQGGNIVLLHGWGSNIELMRTVYDLLTPHFRVTMLDFPGFGKSAEPNEPWDVDNYVSFLYKFLQSQNIMGAIFLGHSFGGRVTIKMCADENCPVIIQKVILVDSAGVLPKKSLKKRLRILTYKACKWAVRIVSPSSLGKLQSKFGSADYKSASEVMRRTLVKVVNEDLTPLFSRNKCETLLIWGENDTDTPVAHARIMEKLMPDAGLVVIKNAGHYSYLDGRFMFNKVMGSFLGFEV